MSLLLCVFLSLPFSSLPLLLLFLSFRHSLLSSSSPSLFSHFPSISHLPPSLPLPPTAKTVQYNIARQMLTWSSIAFHLAVIINILVALFYPFDQGNKALRKPSQMSNVC